MIRVLPDGQVTPCENFGLDGRFSLGNIKQIKDGRDIINHPVLKSWVGAHFSVSRTMPDLSGSIHLRRGMPV